jgi:hypothetical protein
MDVSGVFRGRPVSNSFEFLGIHMECSFADNYSKVIYFFALEETSVGFEVEILFLQFV